MPDKPSHRIPAKEEALRKFRDPLDPIFNPKTVAVVGATEKEGSVGRTILWNLLSSPFGGTVFPVNPKRPGVLGIKAYPNVGAIPEQVDLAVIVIPAPFVPPVIKECVEAGVKGVIVISAGFKELGPEGAALEDQIMEEAKKGGIRIIGPNCLGVMNPLNGMNATFASTMARPGNVGFISQSGALCTAVLDWSHQHNVGFSSFLSIGSMLDVGWGDLIHYLGNDANTKSIVIYMESVGDAPSFLSAAREVALSKPIIVIKAGRTDAAAKAAASHTGALTGSDEVLHAAFRRCGVLRVDSIADLFYMSEVLAKQPLPKGRHLTILTNAGGPGVLATDALISDGGELSQISDEAMKAYNDLLPPHWSRNNPIDILGDAGPKRYADSLEIAAKDPNSDGMLVILTPQAMTDPTQTAEELKKTCKSLDKPVLASWMGGPDVIAGREILDQAGIPALPYPDKTALIFNHMWRYAYNLKGIYETPMMLEQSDDEAAESERARGIIEKVRESGRTILTEFESKSVLSAYDIPIVETRIAQSEEEAVEAAKEIGYPVVLKIHSETITHKTDVGGVRLNLRSEDKVRTAFQKIEKSVKENYSPDDFLGVTVQPMVRFEGYELILGSSVDPQFGPVLLFGTGGQLVEVFKDRALGLPPLNTTLARRMMEQTKILTALKGVRGRAPVNLAALEELLVRFSRLVVEQRWIKEIDINPLLVSPEGMLALDARVLVYKNNVNEQDLPRLAIRPYPTEYISLWQDSEGCNLTFRPIRPEDEPLMVTFHHTLSEDSVYSRYFHQISLSQRVSHERLAKICFVDYSREVVMVVDRKNPETGELEILAVGRLNKRGNPAEAEFAILVSDKFQGRGIGRHLLAKLLEVAPREGISHVVGYILPENAGMLKACKNLGFEIIHDEENRIVEATVDLKTD